MFLLIKLSLIKSNEYDVHDADDANDATERYGYA